MRICLLGEFSGNLDEGMRKTSFYLAEELSKKNQIISLDLRDIFIKNFWKNIKIFEPDIIHYIHGPTIKSFIFAKILSIYCKKSKIVMSAMRPIIPYIFRGLIPLLKPELILTQSIETDKLFSSIGCKTKFLFCGVDIEQFKPVPKNIKKELRKKYGFDEKQFIILHVGSIKEGRNIQLLKSVQNDDNQVLIIGPNSTNINPKIHQDLIKSGCIVWPKYIKNIEEIYTMSDCYIYPTVSKYDLLKRSIADSIETPLSVLEAMACNLPVVATKFGALPIMFKEGDGLFFTKENDFIASLDSIKNGDITINTRNKIIQYSWKNMTEKLENIYSELISNKYDN
jgi:glycosyltransferase involved in cell wall biosynthesis